MNTLSPKFSMILAVVIGLIQLFMTNNYGLDWFYAHYSPLTWLLNQGVDGVHLQVMSYLFEFAMLLILSIPAAFLLVQLRPMKAFFYLLLVLFPGFIWLNVTGWSAYWLGSVSVNAWLSFVTYTWTLWFLPLPIMFFVIRRFRGRVSPNKSLNADASDAGAG